MKNKTLLSMLFISLLLGLSNLSLANDGFASQVAGNTVLKTTETAASAKKLARIALVVGSLGLAGTVLLAYGTRRALHQAEAVRKDVYTQINAIRS